MTSKGKIFIQTKHNFFTNFTSKIYKMKLNKSHLNQSAMYNKIYRSRYLMVSNGMEHIVCEYDWENESRSYYGQCLNWMLEHMNQMRDSNKEGQQ